jgi:glycosyltransferase involved in cell wall biosynthesis
MKQKIFSILKRIIHQRKSVVRLVPDKNDRGCVVLSYLTWPFLKGLNEDRMRGHTNAFEVLEMAQSFLELGFRVEICEWDDLEFIPPSDSKIVIDIHQNLERWDPNLPRECIKVLHATGPHWLSYKVELDRIEGILNRRGMALKPRRQSAPSRAIEVADIVTVLGNDFTIKTFAFARKPAVRIPISSAYALPWPEKRALAEAKRRFLWVGSFGMVQKGLDLVLEAFAQMPELEFPELL